MTGFDYTITSKTGLSIILNQGSQSGVHTTPMHVYALQSYPQFNKEIKNNEIQRQGQNGYWDFYSYIGKITISFEGIIVAENETNLENMKSQLLRVFALPTQPNLENDGYCYLSWTDLNATQKSLEVKLVSDISFDRDLQEKNVMRFQISLKSKTSYIQSGNGTQPLLQSGTRGYLNYGGIFLPTLVPISWNQSNINVLQVNNSLSTTVSPANIRLFGEAQQQITNPRITNLTTGTYCELNTTLLDQNDFVDINAIDLTVKNSAGNDITGMMTLGSTLINLSTSINNLMYTSSQDPYTTMLTPNAIFEVRYYRTYDN
jgi:Phage tail protein